MIHPKPAVTSITSLCVLLFTQLALATNPDANGQLTAEQKLVIGYSHDKKSLFNQQAKRLVRRIKQDTQIEIELVQFPLKRSLFYANNGAIDGDLVRTINLQNNPEYPNLRIVNEPWGTAILQAIGKPDTRIKIRDWFDLRNYSVCLRRGSVSISKKAEENGIRYQEVNSTMQALKLVAYQRCDFTVLWKEQLTPEEVDFINTQKLQSAGNLMSVEGYMYLHKSRKSVITTLENTIRKINREAAVNLETIEVKTRELLTPQSDNKSAKHPETPSPAD